MRTRHRRRVAGFVALSLSVALASMAFAAPPAWTRKFDGALDQASVVGDNLALSFGCAQGGPRPASGFIRVEARSAPQADAALDGRPAGMVTFRIGAKEAKADFGAIATFVPAPGRKRDGATARQSRRSQRDAPDNRVAAAQPAPTHGVRMEFQHDAEPERAAAMAAIVKLILEARGGELKIQAPALRAEWSAPVSNAMRALRGMDRGCIDYIPEPDDEEQGPWQQGLSASDKGREIMLVTQGHTPDGAPLPLKLAVVCDAGDLSIRLLAGEQTVKPPVAAAVRDPHHRAPLMLDIKAGPGVNEASIAGPHVGNLIRLMREIPRVRDQKAPFALDFSAAGFSFAETAFDVSRFDMAIRHMRATCAIPE